jgi:hypothetical protein
VRERRETVRRRRWGQLHQPSDERQKQRLQQRQKQPCARTRVVVAGSKDGGRGVHRRASDERIGVGSSRRQRRQETRERVGAAEGADELHGQLPAFDRDCLSVAAAATLAAAAVRGARGRAPAAGRAMQPQKAAAVGALVLEV